MVVVPLTQPEKEPKFVSQSREEEGWNWAQVAAGAGLLAGGVLLLAGHKRAGLVAAASGTTLALLDQQDTVRSWWNALPGYIGNVQNMLGQVQESVEEFSAQRDRMHKILSR